MGQCLVNKARNISNEKLLWSNPNPSDSFTGGTKTIGLDLSGYKKVRILCKYLKNEENYYEIGVQINTPYSSMFQQYTGRYTYAMYFSANNSGITFTQNSGGSDHCNIPIKIFGVKSIS